MKILAVPNRSDSNSGPGEKGTPGQLLLIARRPPRDVVDRADGDVPDLIGSGPKNVDELSRADRSDLVANPISLLTHPRESERPAEETLGCLRPARQDRRPQKAAKGEFRRDRATGPVNRLHRIGSRDDLDLKSIWIRKTDKLLVKPGVRGRDIDAVGRQALGPVA